MRLTLEKVLILKNIPLFAGIPEAALADIINASEETASMIGTDIVKQGEIWNDLYIILQGQVRAHRNGQTLREFNALTTFGELAALDAETADMTITALEDTTMFKLTGPALYRLMNEHKSLEKNLIKTLCERLRAANRQ